MSDCPGPERSVFYILIADLISKSALVLFILLYAKNYHYSKGPLNVEFIRCKTIHSGLLIIFLLQSISLHLVITIIFIFIFVRPEKNYIMCYCKSTHNYYLILYMFYIGPVGSNHGSLPSGSTSES